MGAPVSPLAGVRAAGVAELPHLSRAIHDYFVDLLLHPMLLAAEKAHGRRNYSPRLCAHGLDFEPLSGLQVYAPIGVDLLVPRAYAPKKTREDSPEQPYTNSLCHFQGAAVAGVHFTESIS